MNIVGFMSEMVQYFDMKEMKLDQEIYPKDYDALIIAKPMSAFSRPEKYVLDQYVMHGGKVMFLIEALDVNMSQAAGMGTLATPINHNLDDMLFRYGIRLNANYIQDIQNFGRYPVVVGDNDEIINLPWPFYASVNDFTDHPIAKNLQ